MIATTLHQIEISTRCNLRCVYCLWPNLTRPKQDISEQDFMAALQWVQFFIDRGTQGELVLTGTGESLLHPDLAALLAQARRCVGPDRRLLITTNGLLVDEAFVQMAQAYNVKVYVSLHRPEKCTAAVHMLGDSGQLLGLSVDPVLHSNSWAGQVDWPDVVPKTDDSEACPWMKGGWLFAGSDGQIYPCCYANGDMPPYAHVSEAPRAIQVSPPPICPACWLRQPWPDEYGQPVRLQR